MFDSALEGKKIIEEALETEGQQPPGELQRLLSEINRRVSNIIRLQNEV